MPLIPFPDVPAFPGVPILSRIIPPQFGALLFGDDPGIAGLIGEPQWGIFDSDGSPIAVADSVIAFEYSSEYRISDYPVEQGGFASYNKTKVPYDARVTFGKGGSDAERQAFLAAIESAEASFDFFTVVTPDATYLNANLVRQGYRRTAQQGASLLTVEVEVQEVRISGDTSFTTTISPSGANPTNGGTAQPQTPTTAQANAAADGAS